MRHFLIIHLLGENMNTLTLAALPKISFVMDYINTRNQVKVLSWLYQDMTKKWDGLVDTNGTPLVKDIHFSPTKTDACKSYATELIARYSVAQGLTLQNWCPESLRTRSRDSEGGLGAIGGSLYRQHKDLYVWVVGFVLGIDPILAEAAVALSEEHTVAFEERVLFWALNKYKFIPSEGEYTHNEPVDLSKLDSLFPYLVKAVRNNNNETVEVVLNGLVGLTAETINDYEADEILTQLLTSVDSSKVANS